MKKTEFLKSVENQLLDIFRQVQIGNKPDKQKYRTEGFMQAGKFMNLVDEIELMALMERTHINVFGMTVKEREEQKIKLEKEMLQDSDYGVLDIPTYIRKKSK